MNNINQMVDRVVDEIFSQRSSTISPSCNWCKTCAECRTEAVKSIVDAGAQRVGSAPDVGPIHNQLAKQIDHTLLKPEATQAQIVKLCEEAAQYGFALVCVNPCWLPLCRDLLKDSGVPVCTVIGFPLGATSCQAKAFEAQVAVEQGAGEVDMVLNVGKLKSGDYHYVESDIRAVVEAAQPNAILKVILETCLLTDEEKIKACLLCKNAGAAYVKTSTGFNKGGATFGDVMLMRKVVGAELGVKASGGVRDRGGAEKMIAAGASRIGASASIKIVSEG